MAIGIVAAVRNSMLQAISDAVDAGAGAGKLRIYSGTQPATGGTETTILAELTMTDPSASTITGGVLTFDTITDDTSANNTGTATWFRLLDSNNNAVCDGTCGDGGTEDLVLDNASINSGQTVSVSSFTITDPNS